MCCGFVDGSVTWNQLESTFDDRSDVGVPPIFRLARRKPAAEKLQGILEEIEFRAPQVPVRQNVHAREETDPERIRDNLVAQLYRPVRWADTIRAMHAEGITTVLECGPGKVLTGLCKRIERSLDADSLEQLDRYLMEVSEGDES